MAAKKYANKAGMMHESKGRVLASPIPTSFSHNSWCMKAILGSYLITTYNAHIPIRLVHCICC